MKFIKIDPRSGKEDKAHAKKIIRVLFSKVKIKKPKEEYNLTIYIGKELAEKLKINIGDKLSVSREEQNSRILLIGKSDVGYKVAKVGKKDNVVKVTLRWQLFVPQGSDFKTREVKHEFYENGIMITVPASAL